jgi:hypothetical protein
MLIMKDAKVNAILDAAKAATAAAGTKINPEPKPKLTPKRTRFSGYFSEAESQDLTRIRAAFAGERLADNVIVRASIRAAKPDALKEHIEAILAEDRRLKG